MRMRREASRSADRIFPDVVVVDKNLADRSAVELTPQRFGTGHCPDTAVEDAVGIRAVPVGLQHQFLIDTDSESADHRTAI